MNLHFAVCLKQELLARSRRHIWSLSDSNGIRMASSTKWLSIPLRSGCGFKSRCCHLFHSFTSSFSFCFALISEVFLRIDICLCGNNVGIAVEINFLFIGVSEKSCFCKSHDLLKYLSSKWSEQTKTFDGKLPVSLLIAANQLFLLCGSLGKLK